MSGLMLAIRCTHCNNYAGSSIAGSSIVVKTKEIGMYRGQHAFMKYIVCPYCSKETPQLYYTEELLPFINGTAECILNLELEISKLIDQAKADDTSDANIFALKKQKEQLAKDYITLQLDIIFI